MCFVDLTKAFDRIKLTDVATLLTKHNISINTISLINELNCKTYTKVRVPDDLTNSISISTGIRQGDSLSPLHFNIVTNEIILAVKNRKLGYKVGNYQIPIVCYADDAVLMADSEDNLQRLLMTIKESAERYNMIISIEKTKSLVASKQPIRCKLCINNQSIEQVMNFNYLGTPLSYHRDLNKEVATQANKEMITAGAIRSLILTNKHILPESKIRIYKTCIRPIMTYGIEARPDTATTTQKLEATEMKILRSIKGVSLRENLRSSFIRNDLKVEPIKK